MSPGMPCFLGRARRPSSPWPVAVVAVGVSVVVAVVARLFRGLQQQHLDLPPSHEQIKNSNGLFLFQIEG